MLLATPEDIKFLEKSDCWKTSRPNQNFQTKNLENVSIITALNAQKDRI